MKTILVVDDDVDLVVMLEKFLNANGFRTESALTGAEALGKVFESGNIDLIILDIMLPGIDGYEVCRNIKMKRETNSIPVIMLSAKDSEYDKIIGFRTGADSYICKPFDVTELLKVIYESLEKKHIIFNENGVKFTISFKFQSQFKYLEQVNSFIEQLFIHTEFTSDEIWEIKLALHELGVNAIEHGNRMNPEKIVGITSTVYENKLVLEVIDEGDIFCFTSLPDPTHKSTLTKERGRGIYLVTRMADNVEIESIENTGKKIILTKNITR